MLQVGSTSTLLLGMPGDDGEQDLPSNTVAMRELQELQRV